MLDFEVLLQKIQRQHLRGQKTAGTHKIKLGVRKLRGCVIRQILYQVLHAFNLPPPAGWSRCVRLTVSSQPFSFMNQRGVNVKTVFRWWKDWLTVGKTMIDRSEAEVLKVSPNAKSMSPHSSLVQLSVKSVRICNKFRGTVEHNCTLIIRKPISIKSFSQFSKHFRNLQFLKTFPQVSMRVEANRC